MKAVLPLLIERARQARDQLAVQSRQAAQRVQQAAATREQLESFRQDYLRRAPGRAGQPTTADGLQDWQRFVTRLDQAIALQVQDLAIRQQQAEHAQVRLAEGQRRLTAFQALDTRQHAAQSQREQRAAQRDSDEFAARATLTPPP